MTKFGINFLSLESSTNSCFNFLQSVITNSAERWYIWARSYSNSAPRTELPQEHTEQDTKSRCGPFSKGKNLPPFAGSRTAIYRLPAVCAVEACQNFTMTIKFRAITTFLVLNMQTFRTVICGPVHKRNGSSVVKYSRL